MKTILRAFQCPECQGKFSTWLEKGAPPPDYCHLCKADMGAPIILTGKVKFLSTNVNQGPMPTRVNIGSAQAKSPDQVYRQMEAASIVRAEEAASQLGIPVSEVEGVKMTNMKDNVREGETSVIMPTPSAPSAILPPISQTQGQYFAQQAQTSGPLAGKVGNAARENLTKGHAMRQAAVARNGQMGSFTR